MTDPNPDKLPRSEALDPETGMMIDGEKMAKIEMYSNWFYENFVSVADPELIDKYKNWCSGKERSPIELTTEQAKKLNEINEKVTVNIPAGTIAVDCRFQDAYVKAIRDTTAVLYEKEAYQRIAKNSPFDKGQPILMFTYSVKRIENSIND